MTHPAQSTIGPCRILHANCLDALASLPAPSGGFDALITDPPYSSGGRTAAERHRTPSDKYVQQGTHAEHNVDFAGEMMDARSWTSWCITWLELARQQVKPGGYAVVFTDWRQLPALTDAIQIAGWHWRGVAVWDKGTGARGPHKGYFRHQCEYIVWASNGPLPAAKHGGPWPGCYKVPVVPKDKLHMTGKPVQLMRELVSIVPPGGHVLDPFMGSASTGVVCIETGRRFTGVEVTPQVIIGQGGRAHFTGWYSPAFHQAGKHQAYLQRGKSGWEVGVFWFCPEGPIVKYDGPLTKELFIQLTGWPPKNEAAQTTSTAAWLVHSRRLAPAL